MAEASKLSVFLCHSPADKAAIRDLYSRLSKYSWIDPWLDEEKLLPGHERKAEISKALENAHVIIIGLSRDSITKEGPAQAEFKYAQKIALEKPEGTIFIIPLNLEDVKDLDIPRELRNLQNEDYYPNKRRVVAFERILRSLKARADVLSIQYEENSPTITTSNPSKNKYAKENLPSIKAIVSNAEFPIHEIPFRRNPNFTGRKDILDSIHTEFNATKTRVPIHTIKGMGGIGKTQTAIHYSYEFAKEYGLVYWIRSETDASLTADYEALTQALQLPVKTKAEQLVYVNIVNNWLENTNKKWLLVFDNVDSQEKIEKLLPQNGNGHILITSQSPNWKELGEDSQIRPFTHEETREFIMKRLGEKELDHSDKLNELLGGLPLAVDQACAYMSAHGTPIEMYIRLFEEQQEELWKRETHSKDYRSTIVTTWEMAFKQIQESHPIAKQLLNLFAFLGPDDIPLSVINTYAMYLPKELQNAIHNPIELEENLSAIYRYSLVERNGNFVSLHRLVQDVIRTQLPKDIIEKWVQLAIRIMKMAFPYSEYDVNSWANCAQLLPHAFAAASYAEKYSVGLEEGAEIYQKAGEYLREQAEYQRACEAIEHAINIKQEILGPNHENLAISLDYLGEIKQEQANFAEALKLHNQALQIIRARDRIETPQGARTLNNLGQVFHYQGELEKAKDYYENALSIYSNALKNEHPDTSMCLNNLGVLFRDQSTYAKARSYHEDSLSRRKEMLGENHPHVAMSLNNLALSLKDDGELAAARRCLEEAHAINVKVLGENHPDIANRLNNLGAMLAEQGEDDVALEYFERAAVLYSTALGETHPSIAAPLSNIGAMLYHQSKYTEARGYLERALHIEEKVYGTKYYKLIQPLVFLAKVMFKLRLFPLAREYSERARRICSEATIKYQECEDIEQLTRSIPSVGKKTQKRKN